MPRDWEEISTIEETTEFFNGTVEFIEQDLPVNLRRYVPNALLNVAVARLLSKEGRDRTASILDSLSYAVATGSDPRRTGPFQLVSGNHRNYLAPVLPLEPKISGEDG